MDLNDRIEALARARKIEAEYKQELADLNAEIEEVYGKRMARAKSLLATAKADVTDYESEVRECAVAQFVADGGNDAKPHPSVRIKRYTVLAYDPDEAFRYCAEYLTSALTMNKRKFEAVAGVAELDFVTIGTEPRATIARDLSEYLEVQE